ncbi:MULTISPECIES: ABC transporter permease [unclassified Curtobacterium]|uniref:ABC transporter permease n=1 Tax=unclassified Curtobacterium TaxID=257496 RepID=UPI000D8A87F5|nr:MULTISPECIES: ABC transporter permease [unclassified Curtobacterium]PYY63185.1 ABC transporter permease [Curtobacterium sp. MCSS17_011]WIB31249.1 ABC transporter permease [Curtobacterium sp. MCSS17_005]
MVRFIGSRVTRIVVTVLAVLTFAFVLARLTGDPVRLMLPDQATQADVEAARHSLGLDRPLLVQYVDFMAGAFRGDLGDSIRQGQSALGLVLERLPNTVELALTSFVIGFALAVALAVVAETTGSKRLRSTLMWLATVRQAIPPYLFGILLVLVFSVSLGLLPAIGRTSYASFVLPVATMATFEVALYLRLISSSFDESRALDYVRTARAKGVSRGRIVVRHMLPNALLPVITIAGINLGVLMGGTVVLEMVFNWPGLGRLIVQGVTERDYPIVQAGVVLIAMLFVAINFIVDMLYAVLDPRVRLS